MFGPRHNIFANLNNHISNGTSLEVLAKDKTIPRGLLPTIVRRGNDDYIEMTDIKFNMFGQEIIKFVFVNKDGSFTETSNHEIQKIDRSKYLVKFVCKGIIDPDINSLRIDYVVNIDKIVIERGKMKRKELVDNDTDIKLEYSSKYDAFYGSQTLPDNTIDNSLDIMGDTKQVDIQRTMNNNRSAFEYRDEEYVAVRDMQIDLRLEEMVKAVNGDNVGHYKKQIVEFLYGDPRGQKIEEELE